MWIATSAANHRENAAAQRQAILQSSTIRLQPFSFPNHHKTIDIETEALTTTQLHLDPIYIRRNSSSVVVSTVFGEPHPGLNHLTNLGHFVDSVK
jgi:hypothetical protein